VDDIRFILKLAAKTIVPYNLYLKLRHLFYSRTQIQFNYGFRSWEEAQSSSEGYDGDGFIEKLRNSAIKVKLGEFAYERDGVGFSEIEYDFNFLSGLLYSCANSPQVNIVDFGGGLGSTYNQYRSVLSGVCRLNSWTIVEQEKIVEIGNQDFKDGILGFSNEVGTASQNQVDLIILGGVLQYLPNPLSIMHQCVSIRPKFILIDRTPFSLDEVDKFAVQKNPTKIYKSSYPLRVFSRSKFHETVKGLGLKPILEWESNLQPDPTSLSRGYLFEVSNFD